MIRRIRRSLVAVWSLAAASLLAQPTPPSPPKDTDDIEQLNPFSVTADQDVGYLAANTLSGSRLKTPLKDTAATIDVMTSEFLADLGETDLTRALEYANNVQHLDDTHPVGAAGNDNALFQARDTYQVRGVDSTTMRNYIDWNMPVDTYNLDRIEESHGPNPVLFGIGAAGGIINLSTKQANLQQTTRKATAQVGSFGSYRGTVDLNQSMLDGRLGVRVDAVDEHGGSHLTYGGKDFRALFVTGTYKPLPDTIVRLDFEVGKRKDIQAGRPLFDAVSPWRAAGSPTFAGAVSANSSLGIAKYGSGARVTYIANDGSLVNMASRNFGPTGGADTARPVLDPSLADLYINSGGPEQTRDTDYNATSVYLDQKFGEKSYLQLTYTHQDQKGGWYRMDDGSNDGDALSFDPNLTLANGAPNPYGGSLMLDTNWRHVNAAFRGDYTRLTASTEFNTGTWGRYRVAAMGEYDYSVTSGDQAVEVWAGSPFNANPDADPNLVFRRYYIANEGDWSSYYHNSPMQTGLIDNLTDPVTGKTLSSTWVYTKAFKDNPSYLGTAMVGGQGYYFSDRLVVGFGLRFDRLRQVIRSAARDPDSNEFAIDWADQLESTSSGRTKSLGAVAHVTKNLSLIYNYADNFDLPNDTRILPDSLPGAAPRGKGMDVGIATTLLGGKLYGRLVYYKSSTIGSTAAHGFGSGTSSPQKVVDKIMDALVTAGQISPAEADTHRVDADGVQYDRTSDGYELNLVANPTESWRLQLNYSYTNSYEDNIGNELKEWWAENGSYFKGLDQSISVGKGTIESVLADFESAMEDQFAFQGLNVGGGRQQKLSLFTMYTVHDGPLAGLSFGGGYRHQSKIVAGRAGPEGELLYGRSYWNADGVLGYRFQHVPLLKRLRLQLNIYNLFDDRDPLVTKLFDDGSIRRVVPIPPRTWRLSATLEF